MRWSSGRPPRSLVGVVLPAGAACPAPLAVGPGSPAFAAGAAPEAVAITGFALAVVALVHESDRTRVRLPRAGDRSAAVSMWAIAAGLAAELLGRVLAVEAGIVPGQAATLAGSLLVAHHVLGAFHARVGR